jgi:hypothetical protein
LVLPHAVCPTAADGKNINISAVFTKIRVSMLLFLCLPPTACGP